MSVTMTPLTSDPGSYLAPSDARTLAASLPGADLATLLAKYDADLAVLLFVASLDLDAAMPYQGVRYSADQLRQFPRYQRVADRGEIHTPAEQTVAGVGVWDWDSDTQAAVVPQQVKIACVYQAASLLDSAFQARLAAIRSGLASQSVGSLSESYVKASDLPGYSGGGGGAGGLCDRAQRLMDRYRLRTAQLL